MLLASLTLCTGARAQTFNIGSQGGQLRAEPLTLQVPAGAVHQARFMLRRQVTPPLRLPLAFGGPAKSRFLVLASPRTKISASYVLTVRATMFQLDSSLRLRDPQVPASGQTIYTFGYVFDGRGLELWGVGRDGEITASPVSAARLNAMRQTQRPYVFFLASLPKHEYIALCSRTGGTFLGDTCTF